MEDCSKIQSYLRDKACCLVHENFSAFEASRIFSVDYKNMCAYLSGRKSMPLRLAFEIFDYLGCNVVVFRRA